MENQINNIKEYLKNNFIFYDSCIDKEGNDIYFCICGNPIKANPLESVYSIEVSDLSTFELLDLEKAGKKANVTCDQCGLNYMDPKAYHKIVPLGPMFYDKYEIEENENDITLIKLHAGAESNSGYTACNIPVTYETLKINKESHEIEFNTSSFEKPIAVHLENMIEVCKNFFTNHKDSGIIDGLINIHDFIGKISKLIIDTKNMHVVEELMSQMIGKSGTDILSKIVTIFFGILCYPNLSTIAITKNNTFLYDLMSGCQLPSPEFLKQEKATSPLKIFNTLISLKNNEIQKKLDSDDMNKLGYVFKSKTGQEFNIKYKVDELLEKSSSIAQAKGALYDGAMLFVRDEISNKPISPFIFNKLRTFSDYEKLIRWLKFISYENLINLVKEYDIDLLLVVFDKLEFRDDIDWAKLKYFLTLMINYGEASLLPENAVIVQRQVDKEKRSNIHIKSYNGIKHEYAAIQYFDFTLYDDCLRMVYEIKDHTEKLLGQLNKIKKFKDLATFHEKLRKYISYIPSTETNESIKKYSEFLDKFRYLEGNHIKRDEIEKKQIYNFEIKIISTPKELLNESIDLSNCGGSFIEKVIKGLYVPFLVYDNCAERTPEEYHKYMMIFEITKMGVEFIGIKSKRNQYGTDRFKSAVREYLIENDISFKEVPSIRFGIKSSEIAYEGTYKKPI